jgi:hypothetical protein
VKERGRDLRERERERGSEETCEGDDVRGERERESGPGCCGGRGESKGGMVREREREREESCMAEDEGERERERGGFCFRDSQGLDEVEASAGREAEREGASEGEQRSDGRRHSLSLSLTRSPR